MITEREFLGLNKDDIMVDCEGEEWIVISSSHQEITVKNPMGEYETLEWKDFGHGNKGIMDEEMGLLIVLNHQDAFIRSNH